MAKKKRVVKRKQPQSIISDDIFIPNHSGQLDAGKILNTPINDTDVANKKYVDDNAGGVDWEADQTPKVIHANNYVDNNTQLSDGDIGAFGYTKDTEVDWTISQAPAVIHADNYTDTDTTDHALLTNVTANQHHAQVHTIVSHDTTATGAELTTVADGATAKNSHTHTHVSTTGRTANDHHAQSHNIASHNDTTATGAELNTLTNGSDADTLHTHDAVTILNPVGAIIMFGGSGIPSGWVMCNGASVLRAGPYGDLFAVIGVIYGSVDGTHFNLPDMKGAFPRGAGISTKFTQDHTTTLGTYEDDSMQQITGGATWSSTTYGMVRPGAILTGAFKAGANRANGQATSTSDQKDLEFDSSGSTAQGGARTGNETRPNNLGVNFIIKY